MTVTIAPTTSKKTTKKSPTLWLSDRQVGDRYSVSRSSIHRWTANAEMNFPQPTAITPGCTRWKLADLEAWEANFESKAA